MNQRTKQPTARLIDLTPALAEEFLGKNPRNRKFSGANYSTVKRAIELGEWAVNGEAIKVSKNGYILDGQHRCRAVAETSITIRTFIIEGLEDETQDTMDTGKTRSLGDILAIHGEPSATSLAAVVRKTIIAERWGLRAATTGGHSGYPLTNRECAEWLAANGWVRDYVQPGRRIGGSTPISGTLAAVMIRMFDDIDAEDSRHFWSRLDTGLELTETDPIYILRRTFRNLNDDSKSGWNQRYIAAITIKAWNAYRAGEEIGLLRFRTGGAKPEAFPEAK